MKQIISEKMELIPIPTQLHGVCLRGIDKAKKDALCRRILRCSCAAAAVICICLLPTIADSIFGYFEDIHEGTAITGGRIVQADNDLKLTVSHCFEEGSLVLQVTFTNDNEIAYRYISQLRFGDIIISKADGREIFRISDITADISDNAAEFILENISLESGEYILTAAHAAGLSKADAPLEIQGSWTCTFIIE